MLRRKRFWLGLIISLVFLGIFVARTDFGDIRDSFSGADYALALSVVPLYFIGFWVRTIRWRVLLRPVNDVETKRLYPVVLIGLMANNVAPARIGELVRAYLVGERESMSKSTVLGTIAVDRVFDALTLVAILGSVVAVSGANSEAKSVGVATALLFALATTVLVALALSPRIRLLTANLISRLPAKIALKAEGLVEPFFNGLVAIRQPFVLLQAALLSISSWIIETLMYYGVGQAFNLDMGFEVYMLIAAAANLALAVFASPGGVGPFEVATNQVLLFFGVPSAAASAYAIALHVLLLAPVIAVGLILVWLSQVSMQQIMGVQPATPAVSGTRE